MGTYHFFASNIRGLILDNDEKWPTCCSVCGLLCISPFFGATGKQSKSSHQFKLKCMNLLCMPSTYESIVFNEQVPITTTQSWDLLTVPTDAVNIKDLTRLFMNIGFTTTDAYNSAKYARTWINKLYKDEKAAEQSCQIASKCITQFYGITILDSYRDPTFHWHPDLQRWTPDLLEDPFTINMIRNIFYDEENLASSLKDPPGQPMLMIIEPNPPQHAPDDNAMLTNSNVIPNMSNADTTISAGLEGRVLTGKDPIEAWLIGKGSPSPMPFP